MEDKSIAPSSFVRAIIKNDVRLVSDLLNSGTNPNQTLDSDGITPLHFAAQSNSLEVIPLLIEAGAVIGAQTEPDGYTALEIACIHGHLKIAQALIAYANYADTQRH